MKQENLPEEIYTHINNVIRSTVWEAFELLKRNQATKEAANEDDFLSAEQAANFLKIKLNTLYSKVEKGELSHYRSEKRKLLFSRKELAELISERKGKSNDDKQNEVNQYRFDQKSTGPRF